MNPISCPWHGAKWDVISGKLIMFPEKLKSLRSFKVNIQNDNVYVHVDFQVIQAFPSFENLKDRQLHFSTEHGA
jgi:hypothetical protein